MVNESFKCLAARATKVLMSSHHKPKRPNNSKSSLVFTYIFWSALILLLFTLGWQIADRIRYLNNSQVLSAEIVDKSSYRSKTSNSRHYSTSYTVTYQFENPYVKQKFELESELAPLVYPLVEKGQEISIYYNEFSQPKSQIRMPHHFWLGSLVLLLIIVFVYLITRTLIRHQQNIQSQIVRSKLSLVAAFFIPLLISLFFDSQSNQVIKKELLLEKSWPAWPALEAAVAKPIWWNEVAIKYFDPMNYTSEEYSAYLKANTGDDKRHRQFKVAYAFLLKNQNDPLQMGWDLAKGTNREFMPLYEFFLEYYMHTEWQGNCSQPCSDATQMVEMAGDLLSMKLDENQIEYSQQLIADIMKYKYDRANNRGKYYFLYAYRRLLEHTHGKEAAHQLLDELVNAGRQEAANSGPDSMRRKWANFWSSSQRKVGMFSR